MGLDIKPVKVRPAWEGWQGEQAKIRIPETSVERGKETTLDQNRRFKGRAHIVHPNGESAWAICFLTLKQRFTLVEKPFAR